MSMSFDNPSIDLAELETLLAPVYEQYGVEQPTNIFDVSRVTRIDSTDPNEKIRKEIADLQAEIEAERAARREEAQQAAAIRQRDARNTIKQVLETYGLSELAEFTYTEIIAKETVNINNPDAIIFALREQPAYQRRFAGNAKRLRAGLAELSPAEYLQMEDQYRTTLRANGLPTEFYDSPTDFQQLIEGDVSPQEFAARIQDGYRAVADADPEVKRQMQLLYGVTEGDLAAYFIDPQRTLPILTRQARAAQIAARGREQAGIQLTGTLAEDLARRGITEAEAQRGFAEIGAFGELRQAFAGEQEISEEQLVGAQFNVDTAAREQLKRRQRGRVAAFEGGGSFARTTGATSGTIRTAVGEAE
jgi:hypothetical protein